MAFGESKGRHLAGNLTRQGKPILLDSAQLNVQLTESNTILDSAEILAIPGLGSIDSAGVNTLVSASDYNRSNRNLIMNGDMQIAQRFAVDHGGTGASSFTGINATTYTIDRWRYAVSSDAAVTLTRDTDVPTGEGFPASFKVDVTTADGTIGASQLAHIETAIEGKDLQHLAYGTSSAKTLSVSFWVKSTKTGTYCFFLRKASGGAAYTFTKEYTISSGSTWEKKTITIAPDSNIQAANGAIANDINLGFRVGWVLADGSDFHGTDNTWEADNSGDARTSTSNQVNFLDNTSNDFYLTGCQLEIGSIVTPFDFMPQDIQSMRCKRYYQRYSRQAHYSGLGLCVPWSTTNGNLMWFLEAQPRANPTVGYGHLSHFDYFGVTGTGSSGVPTGLSNSGWSGGNNLDIGFTGSGFVVARAMHLEFDNTTTDLPAYLDFSAEL